MACDQHDIRFGFQTWMNDILSHSGKPLDERRNGIDERDNGIEAMMRLISKAQNEIEAIVGILNCMRFDHPQRGDYLAVADWSKDAKPERDL